MVYILFRFYEPTNNFQEKISYLFYYMKVLKDNISDDL